MWSGASARSARTTAPGSSARCTVSPRSATGRASVVGLTCRIGRAVYGTIDIIQDVVESGKSILMLGRPGRGKTTKLREVARILSEELKKRVVIVDTSNEIAGDGDIPHPAIGSARRMQVAAPEQQHNVMIEAVENHMPEVIVIDEIGTEQEAFAARTIAERGVQLVGTAHGNSLENLMMNPTLSDLVGGIHAVTLSDDEAKRRGTQKTVLERKAPPTFDVIIEIMEVDKLALHLDVERTVDRLLRGAPPRPEIRIRNDAGADRGHPEGGRVVRHPRNAGARPTIGEPNGRSADRSATGGASSAGPTGPASRSLRQEPRGARPADRRARPDATAGHRVARAEPRSHGMTAQRKPRPTSDEAAPGDGPHLSRTASAAAGWIGPSSKAMFPAYIARDIADADVVIALKATYKREPGKMREAAQRRLPVVRGPQQHLRADRQQRPRDLRHETRVFEETEDETGRGPERDAGRGRTGEAATAKRSSWLRPTPTPAACSIRSSSATNSPRKASASIRSAASASCPSGS